MDEQDNVKPFPSTENLRLSEDKTEFIYGGSIAINRLLDMFRNHVPQGRTERPKYPWHLYLVNGMTLFDNVYEDKMRHDEVTSRIQNEIDMLMTYASSYMSFFTRTRPTFLIYIPQYKQIPSNLRRPTPKAKEDKWRQYKNVFLDITQKGFHKEETNHGYLWFASIGNHRFPHKELTDMVRRTPTQHRPDNTPLFLLTHMVLDLHLSKTTRHVTLAERYTGLIKDHNSFGTKLNTKADVPFNTDTHRLFGDKHLLLPLIKGKKKTELEAYIAKRNWRLKTAYEIRQDILRQTDITQAQLDALKL